MDVLSGFTHEVDSLGKFPDKSVISSLTITADEQQDDADLIVNMLFDKLERVCSP